MGVAVVGAGESGLAVAAAQELAASEGACVNAYEKEDRPEQMVLSWTEVAARFLVARFINRFVSIGNLM